MVEITESGRRRPDHDGLIGQLGRVRRLIRLAHDSDSLKTHLLGRANDPHGDFSAVGDEQFLHGVIPWLGAHAVRREGVGGAMTKLVS